MEQTPEITFTSGEQTLGQQLAGKAHLAKAIHKAMAGISHVAKSHETKGGQARGGGEAFPVFSYRGIDDLLDAIHKPLIDAGLVIIPNMTQPPIISTGTKRLRLRIEYVLMEVEQGETATIVMWAEARDSNLAIGSALSYAYKALAFQLFAVPTGAARDNESDAEPESRPARRQQSAPTARRQPPTTAEQRPSVPAPVETTAGMPSSVAEWKKLAETHDIDSTDVFEAAGVARWSNLIQLSDEAKEALWRTMTTLDRLPTDEGDDHEPQHDPYGYDGPDGAPFEDDSASVGGQDA